MDFYMEGPAKVSLFMYDNQTLIVENFNDEPVDIKLVGKADGFKKMTNLEDNSVVNGEADKVLVKWRMNDVTKFSISVKPHSYQAFKYQ